MWLPLKMHGAATFRAALDEKLDLAAYAFEALSREPGIEVGDPPALSLFAWRFRPTGVTGEALDIANRRLLSAINQRQRVLLTGTTLREGFFIRFCVLSFRTHREHIELALEDIRAELTASRTVG